MRGIIRSHFVASATITAVLAAWFSLFALDIAFAANAAQGVLAADAGGLTAISAHSGSYKWETEPNGALEYANKVSIGTTVRGTLEEYEEERGLVGNDFAGRDYFKVSIPAEGKLIITVRALGKHSSNWDLALTKEGSDGSLIMGPYSKGSTKKETFTERVKKGAYYIEIQPSKVIEETYEMSFAFKMDISKATCSKISTKTYTGKAIKPTPVVKLAGKKLKRGRDYVLSYGRNKNAGTASVTVKGKGNYIGKITRSFRIAQRSISKASSELPRHPKEYTGKNIKPNPWLYFGETMLKLNRDYTVSYRNNKNIGKAYVTCKGKGNYKGKKALSFTIGPQAPKILLLKNKRNSTGIGFELKWSKVENCDGYKIMFWSGDKKVSKMIAKNSAIGKKAHVSFRLSKQYKKALKGDLLPVYVGTYKKVGGKTYSSGNVGYLHPKED